MSSYKWSQKSLPMDEKSYCYRIHQFYERKKNKTSKYVHIASNTEYEFLQSKRENSLEKCLHYPCSGKKKKIMSVSQKLYHNIVCFHKEST